MALASVRVFLYQLPMTDFGPKKGVSGIVRKMQRALRNGTGCNLSQREIAEIVRSPAWMLVLEREGEEMLAVARLFHASLGSAGYWQRSEV